MESSSYDPLVLSIKLPSFTFGGRDGEKPIYPLW